MTDRRSYTAREKLRCIERELKFRTHVYPHRIHAGKMTQRQADREIAVMEEIAADYVALIHHDERKHVKAAQDDAGQNEIPSR